jgi:hypothetical protein
MILTPQDAELFFKLHRSLMCFVNERLQVVPGIGSPDKFAALPPETRLKVRDAFLDEPDLIELFIDANPFNLTEEELEIIHSWRHQIFAKFFVFRYLKSHTIFLQTEEPPVAFGVLALSQPFEDMIGPYLPVWTETVLMPFKGRIVYDGLMNNYNISFGPGIRKSINESYKAAKESLGIVTSLPLDDRPVPVKARSQKSTHSTTRAKPEAVREVLTVIVSMINDFCRQHLNEEYADLCRNLAEKLARKRPSPLISGKPNTWACGIVRTIGWVNYLDDRTSQPHMKLTAIDKAFGVGESTGQGKSKQIRKLLKIHSFDPHWTLPSRMDDNPLIWMLEVNGFMMDIRQCPREAQEIAFQKGLIPYIPADRESSNTVEE